MVRVDIVGERQRDNVRGQPFDHRTGLRARAAMGVMQGRGGAGLLGPIRCKTRIIIRIKRCGRVVGDVQQRIGICLCGGAGKSGSAGGGGKRESMAAAKGGHVARSLKLIPVHSG